MQQSLSPKATPVDEFAFRPGAKTAHHVAMPARGTMLLSLSNEFEHWER